MTSKDFIDLVARMRAKQKEYFAGRDSSVMLESKELERHVDRAITELKDGQKKLPL